METRSLPIRVLSPGRVYRKDEVDATHSPMLEILTRNYNFRNKSVRLYELGRVYFKRDDALADEHKILSLGAYGGEMWSITPTSRRRWPGFTATTGFPSP